MTDLEAVRPKHETRSEPGLAPRPRPETAAGPATGLRVADQTMGQPPVGDRPATDESGAAPKSQDRPPASDAPFAGDGAQIVAGPSWEMPAAGEAPNAADDVRPPAIDAPVEGRDRGKVTGFEAAPQERAAGRSRPEAGHAPTGPSFAPGIDPAAPTVLFDRPIDLLESSRTQFGFAAPDGLGDGGALDRALAVIGFSGREMAANGTNERAGVIASFILNAAMIPGWPPARPIEGVALKAFAGQWPEAKTLTKSDLEMLLYLANLGVGRKELSRLLQRLDERRRRSKLMACIAAMLTNVTAMAKAFQEEIERLVAEQEDERRMRHPGSRSRIGLR